MARSKKKSVAIPHAILEGLEIQRLGEGGALRNYPSENAVWVGLGRYQLISGKGHPITEAIAALPPEDQDAIDDFLLALAQAGLNLKGSFLDYAIRRALAGDQDNPTSQDIPPLLAGEILDLAKRWRAGEPVLEQIRENNHR